MKTAADKDRATLEAIGLIYCRAHHIGAEKDEVGLCESCREAIDATLQKAQACPHGHTGNCQDCDIKCQRGIGQKRIKEIMRYSAPRMLFRHPLMTFEYMRKRFRTEHA